jgi:inositol-phosphate transport system ATP-binding protein
MSVFENIVFSMKLKKKSKEEMIREADRVAGMLGIGDLLKRKPGQLSGGQQQRVALGRALIKKPELLLFDEPLSNLDARLRITMRSEIKRLQKDLNITSIYVTHDQVEAMTMADRVAVIKDGKLQAFMPPIELHEKPRTKFIAHFVGNPPMNFFNIDVVSSEGNMEAANPHFTLPLAPERSPKKGNKEVILGIRPEDISINPDSALKAEILLVEPLGRDDLLQCRMGSEDISILADPKMKYRSGDIIGLNMDNSAFQFFDCETEKSLLWFD